MSSLSEQDPLNPNDPSYYAPRWLRERAKAGLSPSHEPIPEPVRGPIATIPEPARSPIAAPASLDIQLKSAIQLKNAVSNAWNPLDPEVIHEPAGLARELDRRAALYSVATRFAAAAGVVTVVALFFFIMVPASRQSKPMVPASQQSDASSTSSEITGSVRTALPQSDQGDGGSKPMVPAPQQSDASSTSSEITGSVRTAVPQSGQGDGGSKPMVPASQQSDASSTSSEITGSVRTALPQSGQAKPALAEFQAILAPAPASQPATHEQSQQLLQQFLQWRQKANSTETSR